MVVADITSEFEGSQVCESVGYLTLLKEIMRYASRGISKDTMQNKVPNFASFLSRKFSLEYSAELFELEIEGTQ